MKKALSLFVFTLFIVLCGCDYDFYEGKRPFDYPNTAWICAEYNMSFKVNSKGDFFDEKMLIESKSVQIEFLFEMLSSGVSTFFTDEKNDEYIRECIFVGGCKFNENWFTIEISETYSDVFQKNDILTFLRTDLL